VVFFDTVGTVPKSNQRTKKYHTVETVPKSNKKKKKKQIQNKKKKKKKKNKNNFFVLLLDFGTVPTVWYFCFLIRFWNCSDGVVFFVFFKNQKYHTVGTVPKSNQKSKIPHRRNSSKI
jgi:hypothetical protein